MGKEKPSNELNLVFEHGSAQHCTPGFFRAGSFGEDLSQLFLRCADLGKQKMRLNLKTGQLPRRRTSLF